MKTTRILCSALLATLIGSSQFSQAATIAQWDFNDPSLGAADGVTLPDSSAYTAWDEAATDKSGNGNHLTTWDAATGSYVWTNNSYYGDFAITPGGASASAFTWSSNSAPSGIDIETITPTNFTVEAVFTVDSGDGTFRTLVGRDGRNLSGAANNAALYFGLDNANHVIFEFTDTASQRVRLISSITVLADPAKWYHMAGVSDGTSVTLYLDGVVVASSTTAMGGLATGTTSGTEWHAGGWSVGRGLYAGNRGDFFKGKIDEVAISDAALDLSSFVLSKNDVVISSVSPTDPSTNSNPVLEAVVLDWGSEFDSATMYLDGSPVSSTVISNSPTSHTVRHQAANLDVGVHTGKVVVVGMNPVSAATNEWTFRIDAIPPQAAGVLYNINFAGSTGNSRNVADGLILPAGSSGSNLWNNFIAPSVTASTPVTPYAMYDSNGNTNNAIGLSWYGADHDFARNTDTGYLSLFSGWYGSTAFATGGNVELSGLDTNTTYDIYVYSTWRWNANPATFTITEGTGAVTNLTMTPVQANIHYSGEDYTHIVDGSNSNGNYVVFTGLTPSAAGQIDIKMVASDGGFEALQVVEHFSGPGFAPTISSIAVASGNVTINWDSDTVGTYRIESTTALSGGSWTPVSGATGLSGGTGKSTIFPVSGDPAEFFRVYGE